MHAKQRKPQRRRAKQARAQATVSAILEAAAQVLGRDGYARASTNRIAERAGVSVGSVYEYFRDKDELIDALIQQQLDALLAQLVAKPLDPARPLEEVVRQLVFTAFHAQQRYGPELYRQLEHVPHAAFRRRLTRAKDQLKTFVRALLERHRDRLRVEDLDLAVFVVVNAAEGVGYNAGADVFNERLADEVSTLVVRYLIEGPPSAPGAASPRPRARSRRG